MDVTRVPVDEAKAHFDRGDAVFLDTRSAESFEESDLRIPGSIRVPPDEVAEHLDAVPPGRDIITYCT